MLECAWRTEHLDYIDYHDRQWGRPVLDGPELFAKLCLDGQQAGLSWLTILRRTQAYHDAFHGFEPEKVAAMTESDVERLLNNSGIIRHRGKIESIIRNARAYLDIDDFSTYLWGFMDGRVQVNQWSGSEQVPTANSQARAMARDLKKRGFSFVGETICYAFMQAVGMVNDHLAHCPCHRCCVDEAKAKGLL
ncbi:DNA-3-methyladenine glycosylase I [Gallaecimonas sp. GXIMD4217]|uniref:DNA-3-methyladenine glycosylase I n=1 Tax=Gallaecimonas sp. GXIMD4217 TaxID=3131927 RepID=UPI00311ABEBB